MSTSVSLENSSEEYNQPLAIKRKSPLDKHIGHDKQTCNLTKKTLRIRLNTLVHWLQSSISEVTLSSYGAGYMKFYTC